MNKDVGIANSLLDEYFPDATMLRVTRDMMADTVRKYGEKADYMYAARMVEESAHVDIAPRK